MKRVRSTTDTSTYVKRKKSEELVSTSTDNLLDQPMVEGEKEKEKDGPSPNPALPQGSYSPFDHIPNELTWKILKQVVVMSAQQRFVSTFTAFNPLVNPKNLPKNPLLSEVSVEKILHEALDPLSNVCASWNRIVSNNFFKTSAKQRLITSEPGLTYRRRPKKLWMFGLDPTVIGHCVTGFEGHLLALTSANELITYDVITNLPSSIPVRLQETDRYLVKDAGHVQALMTIESAEGERLIVMFSRTLLTNESFIQTMTLAGSVIKRWTLGDKPTHIFRNGHGVFTVLYGVGNEVFSVRGDTVTSTLDLNVNTISNNYYPPKLASVISDYSYVIDKRGCVVVAESGRTQLLDYNGDVILPRFFRYETKATLGWTLDWLNFSEGIMLLKDLSLEPKVYQVLRD